MPVAGAGMAGLTAAIIAVGSELLTPEKTDTNSLYITQVLNDLGIAVRFKSIVGDHREELASHVAYALSRHQILILCGGLGPTDDDMTRDVVAGHLGLPMAEDPAIISAIEKRFECLLNNALWALIRRNCYNPVHSNWCG